MALIRDLREKSGAPISDVKAALVEAQWSIDNAFQALRKKGLAAATKKASRHAAEGLVGIAKGDGAAAVVEINSETDFVARNDQFRHLVGSVAAAALRAEAALPSGNIGELDIESLAAAPTTSGSSVGDAVSDVAGTVRENIKLRRAHRLSCPDGVIASYLHTSPAPGLGRMGALVALQDAQGPIGAEKATRVEELGTKLAMHAVAVKPLFLSRASVSKEALEAEKDVLREQAAKTGKPANIIEKMLQGRLNKYYEENCFLEQKFVMDDSKKVQAVVKELGQELDLDLQLSGFVRLQCGEGLEKSASKDFATEVAETLEQAVA
ncbi:hypothetical protein WJX72_007019 [[Myrmecia] bisecta]|uniref:Elongation factor Ts, mitochondrial n=1 Tax=[Myrmecia] bisecta TaxID=41462 RepID=A0AAW1PKB6_9CHLO